jgi:hypothetical protein
LFTHLIVILAEKEDLDQHYLDQKKIMMSHQNCFSEDFKHHFPDATLDTPVWKLVQNPFNTVPSDTLQEWAVKLKCHSSATDNFKT